MRYQAPRGTQDILPETQRYWHYLVDRFRRLCELFGYEEIETPIFEATDLFIRGVGEGTDIVDKEMYTFDDKGGDSLTLRPEFTAPVMRAYLEHGMHTRPQPVRLYSLGPVFRYERPQAGRFREHHQFNVEAIGEADPALDAEIISIPWELAQGVGFRGLTVQLNSIGCLQCRPTYLAELVAYYQAQTGEICPDCLRRLKVNPMRLLDCKEAQCQPAIAGAPRSAEHLCAECEEHFATLRRYLSLFGLPYELNPRLVRGFDYYTKTVFEIWAQGIGAQNAVCGGGRYDGLAEALGGRPTPGVGFASGIERLILTMQKEGIEIPPSPSPAAFLANIGPGTGEEKLKLMAELHAAGISATTAYGERSLRAQLRQADRAGARFTIVIGEEELARGQVAVRDMRSGEQLLVDRDKVAAWLEERLAE